jgi:hypothetical protein
MLWACIAGRTKQTDGLRDASAVAPKAIVFAIGPQIDEKRFFRLTAL